MIRIILISLMALLPLAMAYPSGAPAGACTNLTPGHRVNQTVVSPQTGTSPYSVEVSGNKYSPSGSLTVSITGATFRGLLLQARLSDNSVVGTFSSPPTNTKLTQCTNADDSVTHSSSDEKSAGTAFTWNGPGSDVGAVKFTATVLQDYDVFWVGLESASITASSAANWITVNVGFLISLVIASLAMSR